MRCRPICIWRSPPRSLSASPKSSGTGIPAAANWEESLRGSSAGGEMPQYEIDGFSLRVYAVAIHDGFRGDTGGRRAAGLGLLDNCRHPGIRKTCVAQTGTVGSSTTRRSLHFAVLLGGASCHQPRPLRPKTRTVRSFDPCLPCGGHMSLGDGKTIEKVHSPTAVVSGEE